MGLTVGWGEGSEDPWAGQGALLGGLPTPLVILSAGPFPVPHFCPRHHRNICWFMSFLYPMFTIAPAAHACSYFQSPTVPLFSLAQGDFCPGASTSVRWSQVQLYFTRRRDTSWDTLLCKYQDVYDYMKKGLD